MSSCPSVHHEGMECNREDSYDQHLSLTHRNFEEQMEWRLDNGDKVRWGMVQVKSKKIVSTLGVDEAEVADGVTEERLVEEGTADDNS